MTARFADVVLPLPLGQSYTYRIPTALGDRVVAGARVVVPLRRRELVGLVVGTTDEAPPATVHPKDILGAPDAEPALSGPLLETATWMAGYYGAPIGLAIKAVLPGGMWGSSKVVAKLVGRPRAAGGLRPARSRRNGGNDRGPTGHRSTRHHRTDSGPGG